MSRIRCTNTKIELSVFDYLSRKNYRFEKHYSCIGKPDIAFIEKRLLVFIDSDFWHGWQFDKWANKLSHIWRKKISLNRARDRRIRRKLRKEGWQVMHIWEHQLKADFSRTMIKLEQRISVVK